MSTDVVTKQDTFDNLRAFFLKNRDQLAMAAPKFMTPERLIRVALTAVSRNQRLMECTPASLMGALLQCAQLGLEPDARGHAYLVPFKNKHLNRYEVQFIPGYKGLCELARRSKQVPFIDAHEVREKDAFDFALGTQPFVKHKPSRGERGELTYFYAIAWVEGASFPNVVVYAKEDVDSHRDRYSKAAQDGPWQTDYEAMAKKTCLRQLCKLLPASVELQTAVALDEYAEAQIPQGLSVLAGDKPEEQDGGGEVEVQPEAKKESLKETLKERAATGTRTVPVAKVNEAPAPTPSEVAYQEHLSCLEPLSPNDSIKATTVMAEAGQDLRLNDAAWKKLEDYFYGKFPGFSRPKA